MPASTSNKAWPVLVLDSGSGLQLDGKGDRGGSLVVHNVALWADLFRYGDFV